jgi:NTE family protein
MEADPKGARPNPEDDTPSRRRGIGLCLSGGGYRATLFHLGAIRRLFELGITARPDFETVTSVSGGTLTSARWAIAVRNARAQNLAIDFQADIAAPIHALTSTDIRSRAMAKKYLLPWNWSRGAAAVDALIGRFEEAFDRSGLDALPESPRFVFCGTDMAFGGNFVFERERVGSYRAGYAAPNNFTLAQAVAASASFPPFFGPMRIERAAELFKGGSGSSPEERKNILAGLRVTDGGVYDNMALEPVWKSHRVVLVSDAGGLMDAQADHSLFWRTSRYLAIQEAQARAARKRLLLTAFSQPGVDVRGVYLGVGGSPSRYREVRWGGYTKAFAMDVIANIRTDLDTFSEAERGVLENHGYALMDAAIRTHTPDLIATDRPFALPFPRFSATLLMEAELRHTLEGSGKRMLLGRGGLAMFFKQSRASSRESDRA